MPLLLIKLVDTVGCLCRENSSIFRVITEGSRHKQSYGIQALFSLISKLRPTVICVSKLSRQSNYCVLLYNGVVQIDDYSWFSQWSIFCYTGSLFHWHEDDFMTCELAKFLGKYFKVFGFGGLYSYICEFPIRSVPGDDIGVMLYIVHIKCSNSNRHLFASFLFVCW